MGKLDGKIALVTGGNSGIGLATAKQFVNEGAYVFITGRRKPELDAAVKEIGRNVTGVQGDVSNLGDLDRLFGQIRQEKGKLDIVFVNAGVARFAPFGTITDEFYYSIFDINVKRLLHREQEALHIDVEDRVVELVGDRAERGKPRNPGIDEHNIELAFLLPDLPEEAIEIAQVRHVSLYAGHVSSDFLDGGIQLRLTPSGYEDVGAFVDKLLRRRKANAAIAAGDECDFSVELTHGVSPSEFLCPLLAFSAIAITLRNSPSKSNRRPWHARPTW